MGQLMRFGRKMALPSTRQITHELRVIAAYEDARRHAGDGKAEGGVGSIPVPELPRLESSLHGTNDIASN